MKYDCLNVLSATKSVCIITHLKPDIDALASVSVLASFLLNRFNLNIDVFTEYETLPKSYSELIKGVKLNPKKKQYETAIMIDCPNSMRLGIFKPIYDGAKTKIVIDHHATNDYSGDVNLVETTSSSCEIVFNILKHYKYNFTNRELELIYQGIVADTNNFTVGKFDSKTFEIASYIAKHIDVRVLGQKHLSCSLGSMKILAKAIDNLESFNNGKLLLSTISKKEANNLNVMAADYSDVINRLATIENNAIVCFVYPIKKSYYVSLRAKDQYSVAEFALKNGGGGHKGAAAFICNKGLGYIKKMVLKEFN